MALVVSIHCPVIDGQTERGVALPSLSDCWDWLLTLQPPPTTLKKDLTVEDE